MHFYSFTSEGVVVHRPLLGKSLNLIKISRFKKKKLIAVFIQDSCRVKPYHRDTVIKTSCTYLVPTILKKGVKTADALRFCKCRHTLLGCFSYCREFYYVICLDLYWERRLFFFNLDMLTPCSGF